MTATAFWWLRHAPIDLPAGAIAGRLPVAIRPPTDEQVAALAAQLPASACWIDSGLPRTVQTRMLIQGGGAARSVRELMEQDFGDWTGRSWDEIGPTPEAQHFWADPAGHAPPGGESFAAVISRVARTLPRLATGGDVCIIGHAGVIRAALAVALDLSPAAALRVVLDPLCLTRVDFIGQGWQVGCVNAQLC